MGMNEKIMGMKNKKGPDVFSKSSGPFL